MDKKQFLNDFDDINFMYNNAMMKDSLERHIDDLLESELTKLRNKISEYCEFHAIYDWGILDMIDEYIEQKEEANNE